jgi:hypothetical protein
MAERISRKDDEGVYQPRIHARRIRELYDIKSETGLPLTVLLDLAIREFTARYATERAKAEYEWRSEAEATGTWYPTDDQVDYFDFSTDP